MLISDHERSRQLIKGSASIDVRALISGLHTLSGSEILERILECDNPRKTVRDMSSEDFHWLVKKIGEDDCLPLLKLASVDQWQYLLDLEIWSKDRLNETSISLWLKRFFQADFKRLVRWLFADGQSLAYYYFFRSIEVAINSEDDFYDLPEEFFSLDGIFHIRVIDPEYGQSIQNMIRQMAAEDFDRYQALILGLAGVLPAEMEEEMYRLRNVRLAEHGFMPLEEALSVYAPLGPETLRMGQQPDLPDILDERRAIAPVFPLHYAGAGNMLTLTISGITDPLFLDRIRLEFAGLCNQILSADGLPGHELDILTNTCQKAARYLNLAMERRCGKDVSSAEQLLRYNSLVSVFRVGFGLAQRLKWEAEQWIGKSWFHGQGLDTGFWAERWGRALAGLLKRRPRFYVGLQEAEEYRDFEWLSDLGESLKILRRLMVLDSLLERMDTLHPVDQGLIQSGELTFHTLLFDFWARHLLNLEPGFSGISLAEAKDFFRLLRAGKNEPPHHMAGFEMTFVRDFMAYISNSDPEATSILEEALALVWQEFQEEHKRISLKDLDGRFTKFVSILPA